MIGGKAVKNKHFGAVFLQSFVFGTDSGNTLGNAVASLHDLANEIHTRFGKRRIDRRKIGVLFVQLRKTT